MLRFGKTKVVKTEFYGARKPITIFYFLVDNKVISKFIEAKTNYKLLLDI